MTMAPAHRVLHVNNRWELGGTPRHIHDLSRAQRERGFHVSIAAWIASGIPAFAGEAIRKLPLYTRGGKHKSPVGFARSVVLLHRFIQEEGIDLVHSHSRYVLPLARLALRRLPVAHIHTAHNPFADTMPWVRYPRHIICPTHAVRSSLLEIVDVGHRHIMHVIPHGVDRTVIDEVLSKLPPRPADARPLVVFLGRHTADKGGQLLIEALRLLNERGCLHFATRLIGEGPMKAEWMKRCRALGLAPTPEFRAGTSEPLRELALADIAVFPSNHLESFGYSFVEAAALGVTVVASDIAAFRELRGLGVPCTLFPEGDPAALADALHRIVSEQRRTALPRASPLSSDMFGVNEMVSRTLDVYALAKSEREAGGNS
jgi:phosphatidyl-myo-inositol alpha-mannosyltransferase